MIVIDSDCTEVKYLRCIFEFEAEAEVKVAFSVRVEFCKYICLQFDRVVFSLNAESALIKAQKRKLLQKFTQSHELRFFCKRDMLYTESPTNR